jgi:hypothetical protein
MRQHISNDQVQVHTAIVIPMEDPLIHTDDHPYCDNLSCPCHDEKEVNPAETPLVVTPLFLDRRRHR